MKTEGLVISEMSITEIRDTHIRYSGGKRTVLQTTVWFNSSSHKKALFGIDKTEARKLVKHLSKSFNLNTKAK
jgi:hypothetical protein